MGLLRKGETCVIAEFHRTDLVTFSHSREGENPVFKLNKYGNTYLRLDCVAAQAGLNLQKCTDMFRCLGIPLCFSAILQRGTTFVTSCLLFCVTKPFQNRVYF